MATLLLPLLELPDWRPQPMRTVMHRTAQVIVPKILLGTDTHKPDVMITFPDQRSYPAFQHQSAYAGWSWPMLLLLLYIGGVLVLLTRLGVQLSSLRRLIRQSEHELYDGFTLVRNERVMGPFSFFNWVVLNPTRHASDELEQILRHERVHVRERHSLDMLGAEVFCIVFWFNPAAYLFQHLLHQTLEFSADQTVLAEGIDARAYQYNLVRVSLVSLSAGKSTFTNQFSGTSLCQRIGMMNGQRSGSSACWRYGIWVGLMGILALACQTKTGKLSHRYIVQSEKAFYGVITPRTRSEDLDTLKQVLASRHVILSVDTLVRRMDGGINRLSLTLNVPAPGHPISTTIGSLSKQSVIQAIGLRCDENGCQIGPVDDKYPKRLVNLVAREGTDSVHDVQPADNAYTDANSLFGLYRVFYRNDFLESNYFGYRHTAIRMTPDYHLDLYPAYKNAIVFIDGQEVNHTALKEFEALDLKKVVIFDGKAAAIRLGDSRAENGLVLLYKLKPDIRDQYAATYMLRNAYPQLFSEL